MIPAASVFAVCNHFLGFLSSLNGFIIFLNISIDIASDRAFHFCLWTITPMKAICPAFDIRCLWSQILCNQFFQATVSIGTTIHSFIYTKVLELLIHRIFPRLTPFTNTLFVIPECSNFIWTTGFACTGVRTDSIICSKPYILCLRWCQPNFIIIKFIFATAEIFFLLFGFPCPVLF